MKKNLSSQNAKNDSIAERKTIIAEKTQKLVCKTGGGPETVGDVWQKHPQH